MSFVVRSGSEIRANNFTIGSQFSSETTVLTDGKIIVTWATASIDGFGNKISGHYYSSEDQSIGSEFVIANSTEGHTGDKVTVLSDGKFLVSWLDFNFSSNVAHVYDQNLNTFGDNINLNQDESGPSFSNYTAALPNGGFAYYSLGSFALPIPHLSGGTFSADGTLTDTFGPGDNRTHLSPTLAVLNDGSIVYAWFAGPIRHVPEQPLDAVQTSFGWSRTGASEPHLAKLFDGGFILTWIENDQTFGQRFDKTANKIGNEFVLRSGSVTGLADHSFITTWEASDGSSLGIYGQRYNSEGAALGVEFRINTFTTGDQNDASVAATANGGFVVSWTSAVQDGSGSGIYTQRFDLSSIPDQPPASGKPVNWIMGSGVNDALVGDLRNNSLNGGAGQDKTSGGLGDDT